MTIKFVFLFKKVDEKRKKVKQVPSFNSANNPKMASQILSQAKNALKQKLFEQQQLFEIKSPSENVTENVTASTFYTNKLPPSTNIPNDIFNKSANLSKQSIQDNPYDQRTDQSKCPHQRSENWNSNHCADCGHPDIGGTRVADEARFAKIAKIEDHQYLVDQLSPVLGSMQVTHATLGTGILVELRESNTMAAVTFE